MQAGTSYTASPGSFSKSPSKSVLGIQDRESNNLPLSSKPQPTSRLSPRLKLVLIIGVCLVVVGGAVAGVYFLWLAGDKDNSGSARKSLKTRISPRPSEVSSVPNVSLQPNVANISPLPDKVMPSTKTSVITIHPALHLASLNGQIFCRTPPVYSSELASATKADLYPSTTINVQTFDQIWPYNASVAQRNHWLYVYPEDTRVAVMKGDITSIAGAFIVNSVGHSGLVPDDTTSISFKVHNAADGNKLDCKRQREELEGSNAQSLNDYILTNYPPIDSTTLNKNAIPGSVNTASEYDRLPTAGCLLTPPRYLVANGIVHTCGPDCKVPTEDTNRVTLLYWTIYNILLTIDAVHGHKVVIPLISVGNNQYNDLTEHAAVYLAAIRDYFIDQEKEKGKSPNIQRIMICVYDQKTFNQYVEHMKQAANTFEIKREPGSVMVTCIKR